MREFLFWAVWYTAWLLAVRWIILHHFNRRDRQAGLQKRRREAFHDRQCELHRRLNQSDQHDIWNDVGVPRLFNPPPPPVFGECTGCHLDSIYDPRQPYSKLCSPCVDLAEAKTYNMQTWGAAA